MKIKKIGIFFFTWGYSGWILLTNSVAIETCRERKREMSPQRDGERERVRTMSASIAQWIICYFTSTKEIKNIKRAYPQRNSNKKILFVLI